MALGDEQSRLDPDDSPSALDIESISHSHEHRKVLVHTIRTYEPWDNSILEDRHNEFFLHLRYGRKFLTRRWIVIDVASDGTLYGEINHPRKGEILGYARVLRLDDRTLEVSLPARAISRKMTQYKWAVNSLWHDDSSDECSNDGEGHVITCVDTAPDRGLIRHVLD